MRPLLLASHLLLFSTQRADAGGALAALPPGAIVEVQGEMQPSRGLVAAEIDVRPDLFGNDIELIAPLESVDASRSILRVLGTEVTAGADTDAPPFTSLVVGNWVEIDGTWGEGGIHALRIRPAADAGDVEIEGAATLLDGSGKRFVVGGVPVVLSSSTVVRGIRPPLVQRAVDDDDATPALGSAFDGRLRFGGRLQAAVQPEDNFDLNAQRPGDFTGAQWFGEFQADARLGGGIDAFARAGWTANRVITDQEGDERDNASGRLQQAYAAWSPPAFPDVAVQVGRQDFDEPREWLYDENLDGVRLYGRHGRVRGEASLSTRWNTESPRLKDWTNWIFATTADIAPRCEAGAYVIHRRRSGLSNDDRPTWLGVRSRGRLVGGLYHWSEFALLRGELDGVSREAWATDLGLRWRVERHSRLSLTAGWAVGSGDTDERGRFRQTGLHDNNDKFAGASSFRYYGELVDPELSNLEVLTAGAGLRPLPSSSIDVIFHRYAQRQPFARLQDSNLPRPDGVSTDIGEEWDLVVAFEEIPWMDVEYVFALFEPGGAFLPSATSARVHQLQVQIKL